MNIKKSACVLCGLALAGTLATGCMSTATTTSTQASSSSSASTSTTATPARTYITEVHQVFSDIDTSMDDLVKAAKALDSTAATTALDAIDAHVTELQGIEVPSGLETLQDKYVEATKTLAQSLRDYATYRLQGGASAEDAATALSAIQSSYAQGIATLKEADGIAENL